MKFAKTINGEYVQYSGQGSFRLMDLTVYTPVRDLMRTLRGEVIFDDGNYYVLLKGKKMKLDPEFIINWNDQIFYPFRKITDFYGMKVTAKKAPTSYINMYAEFQIHDSE